jgi:hypothetical protein
MVPVSPGEQPSGSLRRGYYEGGVDARPTLRVAAAFTELAKALLEVTTELSASAERMST